MKNKIIGLVVCCMLLTAYTLSVSSNVQDDPENQRTAVSFNQASMSTTPIKIYVNTSAIDRRTDLTASQKTQLKDIILQHVRDNFGGAIGSGNVTVTNEPSQAASADRSVVIDPGAGDPPNSAWGEWPHGSRVAKVFLGVFMNYTAVNGAFKNQNGSWNITKLGNAIGHTAGHEVGHSYSIGHNHRTTPTGKPQDNRSKMTVGTNINETDRANKKFAFDNHSADVLRRNSGRPPCNASVDYNDNVLCTQYWGPHASENLDDELGTMDVSFYHFTEMPGWYEFGFLGQDTDDGAQDGNPDFDFVYKSSLWMNDIDAEVISFLADNHNHTQWLLRGSDISPFPGEWFPVENWHVELINFIENPVGDIVARQVRMIWPMQGVEILFDTLSFGSESNPFNGFSYQIVPAVPTIIGPHVGQPGVPMFFNVSTTYLLGAPVRFTIDWGDGTPVESIGPVPPGVLLPVNHVWTTPGVYSLRVKALAEDGQESLWSVHEMTITKPAADLIITISGGIGVSAVIKNNGPTDLESLPWSITLDGGFIIIGSEKTGTLDLAAGEEKTISSLVLGFGRSTITVSVEASEQSADGLVFLFFVIGV